MHLCESFLYLDSLGECLLFLGFFFGAGLLTAEMYNARKYVPIDLCMGGMHFLLHSCV